MKVIITGGGTGGHIYPAVSLIEELKKRYENIEIKYIGSVGSLESKIIPKMGIDFEEIRVKGLPRKINKKSFIALKELIYGLKESKKIIKNFNPDFVLGTGGFVTGPVLYNASRMKYKTYFHEQNSYPGLTNRILSRFAKKYFITFEESLKYFKNTERAIKTGNPIRNRFKNLSSIRESSIEEYGLKKNIKTVFSFGGSNGSYILNKTINDLIKNKELKGKFQIVHVTGDRYYKDFLSKIDNSIEQNIKVFAYLDDIQKAYSVADLVITSSGAITLAELAYVGIPSILIPKAYTTENHQVHNALEYEKIGASKMILEKNLNYSVLYNNIMAILQDDRSLEKMRKVVKSLATPNSAKEIIDNIIEDING
ncbi:undecaprenyldiphospho-muramoylpentapeptide beta-N-acetylglucosaminyltransferase [Miniphocaeibacter massiliensis]|uniref:undecaprenyldiphospho-muramoylpentapeptide beta-N-acetylglucosaminyltransferase n=1 Tax=Miniphocaeibacter massiliensis TaxID=2041841 RepID=UPI000C07261C|nr:undecaprenyldiphospho-muramoylpentapeptide beta-N-acetylglucosaminyltransferase [Miniphocaeibacter massiliensis]